MWSYEYGDGCALGSMFSGGFVAVDGGENIGWFEVLFVTFVTCGAGSRGSAGWTKQIYVNR